MASTKELRRLRIRRGIRNKVSGSAELPRLSVFRSNKGIAVQLINDIDGKSIVGVASKVLGVKGSKIEQAKETGKKIAELAKEKGIENVVFDRGGYLYHGRVKALAEGAREGGLKF